MAFSQETIEQIRLATDIVELVREHVPSLKKTGRNWKANCPFHNEKTPSFMVNAEKGIFHCFGCHAGGDAFKFIMMADNLTWPEAVKKLGQRVGVEIKETREEIQKRSEKQKIYDLLEQTADYYHRCLKELPDSAPAKKYFAKRGITQTTIDQFRLGYSPAKQIIKAAGKKGYSVEQLSAAGVITKTERGTYFEYMAGRIIFPIMDTQGRVVAFGGRTLLDEEPKYLNTPETAVYSKSFHLYGLHQALPAIREKREIVVLEGYMDVVVTHQEGAANTVATLGTALTSQHSGLLGRYAESVVLLFDSDAAGNMAAKRGIDALAETELSVRIASLPVGKDPDEYILENGREAFEEYLRSRSHSMVEFFSEQVAAEHGLSTPEAKARCIADVVPVMAKIRNSVIRFEWIKYVAERFGTSEAAVQDELKKFTLRSRNKAAPPETTGLKKSFVVHLRDAEEEILQILFSNPQHAGLISEHAFKNELNRQIYEMLKNGMRVDDIASHIEEKDLGWFTELALEEKNYEKPEQMLLDMTKDLLQKDMELQRKELEKEVIPMINGQKPVDSEKLRLYQDLNRQLKGSVKI